MALGDSNEITYALVAGQGFDRMISLRNTFKHAEIARSYHRNNFQIPELPPNPAVTASVIGDSILLTWGYPDKPLDYIDTWESAGHKIEGFIIYQWDDPRSWEKKKIVTYDKKMISLPSSGWLTIPLP